MICFSVTLLFALEAKRARLLEFSLAGRGNSSRKWGVDLVFSLQVHYSMHMNSSLFVALCVLSLSVVSDSLRPGSSVHGDSPGKNTGVGYYALLQSIFPTQGSDPGLLHCRQILHQPSYQGSPLLCSRETVYGR